jgi:cysteine desulfurase family protein
VIYLDNAATSWPKPEVVYQAVDHFMRERGGNPGHGSHSLAMSAKQAVDEARLLAARLIRAPEVERVVFTLNCTDSLNLVLKGLLKAGDHVVTSALEHNALTRPLRRLEREGVTVTWLEPSPQSGVVEANALRQALAPKPRLVAMIHASNVNGVIQPVGEYGEIARECGSLLLVDAAQTVGHYPVDVVKEKIDFLAFSGHKGPLGPAGVGLLYLSPRADLDTIREGGTGISSESEYQPDILPNKFESGTLNSPGISGLAAGLKFINATGLSEIIAHEKRLVQRLVEGLSVISGISLYHAPVGTPQAPVISFNLKGYEPGDLGAILDQAFDIKVRTGLHCAPLAHKTLGTYPKGTVRASPGMFNTESEIDKTLAAISQVARSTRVMMA